MLRKRIWKPLAGVCFFITLLAAYYFCYRLIKIDVLPEAWLFTVLCVVVLVLGAAGFLLYFGINKKPAAKRRIRRIIGLALCAVLVVGCSFAGFVISKLDRTKEAVANADYDVAAVVGVYVGKDDQAKTLEDAAAYKFGMLGGIEESNSEYAKGKIAEITGKTVEAHNFDSISDAAAAMRDGEVKALAVNTLYLTLLQDSEEFSAFSSELRQIESIEIPAAEDGKGSDDSGKKTGKIERPFKSDENITEKLDKDSPFIIYLSGNDARGTTLTRGRSDVNILMSVNPNTKQILLISTPRDYYVTNPILNAEDKLTHCGLFGVENSVAALEGLYKVPVSGYCQINFSGFEKLIDTLGGIEIDNPKAFVTVKGYSFPEGKITLDGKNALVFARERHAFGDGDLTRGRNQMRVIKAIITKIKTSGTSLLTNYSDILTSLEGMFITDLSSEQISKLVKLAVKNLSDWDVKSCSVSYGSTGYRPTASGGSMPLYVMNPNIKQVEMVHDLINKMQSGETITDDQIAEIESAAPTQ